MEKFFIQIHKCDWGSSFTTMIPVLAESKEHLEIELLVKYEEWTSKNDALRLPSPEHHFYIGKTKIEIDHLTEEGEYCEPVIYSVDEIFAKIS